MSIGTLLNDVINSLFHVPIMDINIFGISKTCFAIAGPFQVSKIVEWIEEHQRFAYVVLSVKSYYTCRHISCSAVRSQAQYIFNEL